MQTLNDTACTITACRRAPAPRGGAEGLPPACSGCWAIVGIAPRISASSCGVSNDFENAAEYLQQPARIRPLSRAGPGLHGRPCAPGQPRLHKDCVALRKLLQVEARVCARSRCRCAETVTLPSRGGTLMGTHLASTSPATGTGFAPCPHLHRDRARPLPTSAPESGSPRPHLHRDRAHPGHICTGTGLAAATSAPGLGLMQGRSRRASTCTRSSCSTRRACTSWPARR